MTDDERAFFGCKEGTFYQYNMVSDAGGTETNVYASEDNGWRGCHAEQDLPCYETELACSVSLSDTGANSDIPRIIFRSNGIPDHNSWAMAGRASTIEEQNNVFRVPKVPVLLDVDSNTPAGQGAIAYASNGVSIFGPYNSGCCDATFVEIRSMDNCLGHPAGGNYHYHYFAKSTQGYTGCHMSCKAGEVSSIVGVAKELASKRFVRIV